MEITKTYRLPQLHDMGSIDEVRGTLDDAPGVISHEFDLANREVTLTMVDSDAERDVLNRLSKHGYPVLI